MLVKGKVHEENLIRMESPILKKITLLKRHHNSEDEADAITNTVKNQPVNYVKHHT